ncbi:MAG: pentapeptide repeat-containing protein [Anaerolineae bacterium]|nr:pentapeptide repeat-containing protein [Anaerolineae bacterium]
MFKKLGERNRDLGNRGVVIILVGIAVLSAVFSALMRGGLDKNWWADVSQGLVTEMAGAVATFWLINLIFEGRRQREQKTETVGEHKAALIRKMRSSIKEDVIRAVEELSENGWLHDGSLREQNLEYVDLRDVNLWRANLQEANLRFTNLQKVHLELANLRGANMALAQLQGASLVDADLQGAHLAGEQFDEHTFLPDASLYSRSSDIRRFTDPNHPQFWRSSNPHSPAYRGNDT